MTEKIDLLDNVDEEFIINEIDKIKFLDMVHNHKIDLYTASDRKKEGNEHFYKFNILVTKLVDETDLTLFDISTFLLEDIFEKPNDVLSCFDENNLYELRNEANEKYHKKEDKSTLDCYMYK